MQAIAVFKHAIWMLKSIWCFCDRFTGRAKLMYIYTNSIWYNITDALVRLVHGLGRIPEVMLLAKHCREFERGYCFGPGVVLQTQVPRRFALSAAKFSKLLNFSSGRVETARTSDFKTQTMARTQEGISGYIHWPVDNGLSDWGTKETGRIEIDSVHSIIIGLRYTRALNNNNIIPI